MSDDPQAALLAEIGTLRGKIVPAFHGEGITKYQSYLPARSAGAHDGKALAR